MDTYSCVNSEHQFPRALWLVPHIYTAQSIPSQQAVRTQRRGIYSAVAVVLQYGLTHLRLEVVPITLVLWVQSRVNKCGWLHPPFRSSVVRFCYAVCMATTWLQLTISNPDQKQQNKFWKQATTLSQVFQVLQTYLHFLVENNSPPRNVVEHLQALNRILLN